MDCKVLSWNQALEQGFTPKDYSYRKEDVPLGEFQAVLDFKVWAKNQSAVNCYFSKDTGEKFILSVYRNASEGYFLSDVDFRDCFIDTTYILSVALNSKKNPKFAAISMLS